MSKHRPGLWRAYRIPALLAAVSVAGLLSALLEDGVFDVVSWLLLGAIVLSMWPAIRSRRDRSSPRASRTAPEG